MKRVPLLLFACVVLLGTIAVVWLQAAPAVGITGLTPAYVVINQPTQVTVTSLITDPTLIATSVNLLSTNAAGKTLSIVGVMRDDGLNGDAKAGDKTFSYRFTVNQPAVGEQYYRVSAAFKGVLQRALSPVQTLHLDPFSLPPDPGEPGKQTLEGIDADKDGVRDDVQRFIGLSFSAELNRASATQFVKARQASLSALDRDSARANFSQRHAAMECLQYTFGAAEYSDVSDRLESAVLNTRVRIVAASRVSSLLSGSTFQVRPFSEAFRSSCSR